MQILQASMTPSRMSGSTGRKTGVMGFVGGAMAMLERRSLALALGAIGDAEVEAVGIKGESYGSPGPSAVGCRA